MSIIKTTFNIVKSMTRKI